MGVNKKVDKVHDPVDHPSHYTKGGIECIQALEAASSEEEFRGFLKLNSMKYLWRAEHKGKQEDYNKAMWYLNYLIEFNKRITKEGSNG